MAREQRMEGLRRELAGLKEQMQMDAEEAALRAEVESARAQLAATRGMPQVPTPLGTPSRTPASPTPSTPQRTVAAAAAAMGKGSPARTTLAEASRRAQQIPVFRTLRELTDSVLPEGSIVTLEGSMVIPSLVMKTAKEKIFGTGKLLMEGDSIDLMVWAGVIDGTFPKTFSRLERVRVTCPQFTGKLTINVNEASTAFEAPPSATATVAAFPAMAPQ
jgi:molybdopterin converting factor small subunit